jgi:hypothetical protein
MKLIIIIILTTFFSPIVLAQAVSNDLIVNIAGLLNSDINELSEGYTKPLINAVILGHNAPLATSTKTLKPFEFQLRAALTVVNVPSSEETFTPSQLNFFEVSSAPTILGPSDVVEIQAVEYLRNLGIDASFEFPSGIKADLPNEMVLLPSFAASVGLLAGTEIQLNYSPEYSAEGVSISSKGIGIKHVIDRYLQIDKESKLQAALTLHYITSNMLYSENNSDNAAAFDTTSFIGNAILSYNTKFLSFFGGLGYFSSNYTFEMNNLVQIKGEFAADLNPLIQDYSIDETKAAPFAFIGSNINLLFVNLVVKYNIQEYDSIILGVNLNF